MSVVKKNDLKRFKKSTQGLIDFAVILEQASPKQRKRIIDETSKIDAPFLEKVLRKTVYFEELLFLDEMILAEILSEISPRILACALRDAPPPFRKAILKHLGYREMKATLDEEKRIQPTMANAFVIGAQKQILKIARQLEAKDKFLFEALESPRLSYRRRAKRG